MKRRLHITVAAVSESEFNHVFSSDRFRRKKRTEIQFLYENNNGFLTAYGRTWHRGSDVKQMRIRTDKRTVFTSMINVSFHSPKISARTPRHLPNADPTTNRFTKPNYRDLTTQIHSVKETSPYIGRFESSAQTVRVGLFRASYFILKTAYVFYWENREIERLDIYIYIYFFLNGLGDRPELTASVGLVCGQRGPAEWKLWHLDLDGRGRPSNSGFAGVVLFTGNKNTRLTRGPDFLWRRENGRYAQSRTVMIWRPGPGIYIY